MRTLLRTTFFVFFPLALCAVETSFRDLFFEPNRGQAPARLRYVARTPGAAVGFSEAGIEIQPRGEGAPTIRVRFRGVQAKARFETLAAAPETTSYFVGSDRSRWLRDVPHYRRVALRDVYPGVDAVFYGAEGRLEYDLIVRAGADPGAIELSFERSVPLSLTPEGSLAIGSGKSRFEMLRPKVYQETGAGERRPVEGCYRLAANGRVRFEVGKYDRTRGLTIDPVLKATTYYGGEKDDSVVAVTPQGDVVGVTSSLAFGDGTEPRGKDVFAWVKMQSSYVPTGVPKLYIFGGSDDDAPTSAYGGGTLDFTVSGQYWLVIAGWTRSSDFVGQTGLGGTDGFIARINRNESYYPVIASLAGGSGDDRINAIAPCAYLICFAGQTTSPDITFGSSKNTTPPAGGVDAFAVAANLDGQAYQYIARLGGSGDDIALAINRGTGTTFYVAGKTTSSDLPLKNPIQVSRSGASDGFLVQYEWGDGSYFVLNSATYFGGSGDDEIRSLAGADPNDATAPLFLAGTTNSTDLPVANAAQATYGGGESDAFAAAFVPASGQFAFTTYIGGSGRDEATAVTVPLYDARAIQLIRTGLVVTGSTTSPNLAVRDALQDRLAGPQDAFVSSFESNGTLESLSYFGGSGEDRALTASVSADNVVTIGGETNSTDLPEPARNESPTVATGGLDGFTASIALTRFSVLAPDSGYWTGTDVTVGGTLFVSADVPETAMLSLTSSDPSLVRVSLDAAAAGTGAVSAPVGRPRPRVEFYITGLADTGEATITIALQGFSPRQVRVRLAPPAIRLLTSLESPPFEAFGSATITAFLGVKNDSDQFVRGSLRNGATPIRIGISVSDPALVRPRASEILVSRGTSDGTYLSYLEAGEATVSFSSSGPAILGPSSYSISIQYPKLTVTDFALGKGLERQLSFVSDTAFTRAGGRLTVTTTDPARLCFVVSSTLCLDTVSVSSALRVRALADSGTAQIRFSHPKLTESTITVQLTRPKIWLPWNYTGASAGAYYVINPGYGSAASTNADGTLAPGFRPEITVTSSNPEVLSVVSVSPEKIVLLALTPGQATLNATAPGTEPAAPLTVTVTQAVPPALTVTPAGVLHVGKDLQALLQVAAPGSGTTTIRVTSSDPSRVVVSRSSQAAGTGEASSTAGTGVFWIQALAGTGSATLTISAPDLPDATVSVSLSPSGFAWRSPVAAVNAYATATVYFASYYLDAASLLPVGVQPLRPGVSGLPSVSSSSPAAGTLGTPGSSLSVAFTGGLPGATLLSLTQPAGFAQPSVRSSLAMRVNTAAITAGPPQYLGKDLQYGYAPSLKGGTGRLRVSSSDPSRLVLSTSSSVPGAAQLDIDSGQTIYLQALSDEGTPSIRITGTSVDEAVFPVSLTQPGVVVSTSAGSMPSPVEAQYDQTLTAMLFAQSPSLSRGMTLRAGAEPLEVQVVSTKPEVAYPVSTVLRFNPGQEGTATFTVRPAGQGVTAIRLVPPTAFGSDPQHEEITVRVPSPLIMPNPLKVGKDMVVRTGVGLMSFVSPSSRTLTLTSSDPSRAQLSTATDQLGQPQITLSLSSSSASFYVQGVSEGTATITASADGLGEATTPVSVTLPRLLLSGGSSVSMGQTSCVTVGLNGQYPRPGTTVSVVVRSSDPSVATVASPAVIAGGQSEACAQVSALAPGSVVITADQPEGFAASFAERSVAIDVTGAAPPNYTLTGTITRNGEGLSGVSFIVAGGSGSSGSSSSSGSYSISLAAGGTYTITPTLSNHVFSPPSVTLSNMQANQIANFTATMLGTKVVASPPAVLGRDLQHPVTIRLATGIGRLLVGSSDTAKLLVSSSPSAAGGAQVTIDSGATVFLQALAGDGTATLRVAGTGVAETLYSVRLVPAAVMLAGEGAFRGVVTAMPGSQEIAMTARLSGAPANGATLPLRPDAAPLAVNVESTNPNVARALTSAVVFAPGQSEARFLVRPEMPGDAVIRVLPPAGSYADVTLQQVAFRVAQPAARVQVGKNMIARVRLSQIPRGTGPMTAASMDPSRVLISGSPDQPGQAQISLDPASAQSSLWVHGLSVGSAVVRASAPGFDVVVANVEVTPTSLVVSGPARMRPGEAANVTVTLNGRLRPGITLPVTLAASDPAVAMVASPVMIEGGQDRGTAPVLAAAPGSSVIAAEVPEGFAATTGTRSFTLTVAEPWSAAR